MNQLTLVKTVASRPRRLRTRRMSFTYQARVRTTSTSSQRFSPSGGEKQEPLDSVAIPTSTKTAEVSLSLSADENETALGSVSYGTVSVIGRRKEMEDAVRVELGFFDAKESSSGKESLTNLKGSRYDFFGVYDGHGGAWVAEACRERMHEVIAEEMAIMSSSSRLGVKDGGKECCWERVMEVGFKRMDEEVAKDRMVGSTAVVAVLGPDEVVVANCGDSRAVLSRAGVAVPLSVDHKPDRPDEFERIEAAGGKVINWNGHRILGVLATSRSIGDEYLKPFVISKPEVTVTGRSELDEFLILASDGLWDVMSNEIACQIGRKCLSGRMRRKSQGHLVVENKAAEAAAILTELAMARGSKDNISVVVVDLKNKGRFS